MVATGWSMESLNNEVMGFVNFVLLFGGRRARRSILAPLAVGSHLGRQGLSARRRNRSAWQHGNFHWAKSGEYITQVTAIGRF